MQFFPLLLILYEIVPKIITKLYRLYIQLNNKLNLKENKLSLEKFKLSFSKLCLFHGKLMLNYLHLEKLCYIFVTSKECVFSIKKK